MKNPTSFVEFAEYMRNKYSGNVTDRNKFMININDEIDMFVIRMYKKGYIALEICEDVTDFLRQTLKVRKTG